MSQIFSPQYYNVRTFVLLAAIIVGLFVSRAMISICTAALVLNFFIDGKGIMRIKQFFREPQHFLFVSIPFFTLLMMPLSADIRLGMSEVWNKLPLLVFALSLSATIEFSKYKQLLFNILIISTLLTALYILTNYLANFDEISNAMKQGKPIPMPVNHIRFAILLSFACVSSLHLFITASKTNKLSRWIFLAVAFVLFFLSHVFSVRSGIVTLYASLIFYLGFSIYHSRRFLMGVLILSAVLSVLTISFFTFPSLKNKVAYMKYDWQQIRSGNVGENSDARRLQSFQVGWNIALASFPLGVGPGNIQVATENYYNDNLAKVSSENRKLPHNQFLWTLVEQGVPGMIALLLTLIGPVLVMRRSIHPIYLVLLIIVGLSMLVEATFETQLGMTAFALFGNLLLKKDSGD